MAGATPARFAALLTVVPSYPLSARLFRRRVDETINHRSLFGGEPPTASSRRQSMELHCRSNRLVRTLREPSRHILSFRDVRGAIAHRRERKGRRCRPGSYPGDVSLGKSLGVIVDHDLPPAVRNAI